MTGWIVATATAATLAAVGAGTFGTRASAQGPAWVGGDVDIAAGLPGAEQAIKSLRCREHASVCRSATSMRTSSRPGRPSALSSKRLTDSPAQKAGFKPGDIVVDFDGERVRSSQQFTRLVQETAGGRSVQALSCVTGSA